MTVTLAFYKHRKKPLFKDLFGFAIRWATRSEYSHVELIPGAAQLGETRICLSSSAQDGGVRKKAIYLHPSRWDLVELPIPSAVPAEFVNERLGAKYDYWGIIFSHLFVIGRHGKKKWFCSEICAAAIGIKNPQYQSPQSLYGLVTWPSMATPIRNSQKEA